jgi:dipeptidyl aminopeptidase/acylaminoacyl peptidase
MTQRRKSLLLTATFALAIASIVSPANTQPNGPPPLIERASFVGLPAKVAAKISPDGRWLSWLAPNAGVLNIWVAPVGALDKARPLTADRPRPVLSYAWAPDSSMILYATDNGGDENYQLYSVDPSNAARRTLTSFARTRVGVLAASKTITDRLLISANNRNPKYFDVLELNLRTGALKPVFQNDAYIGFLADDTLTLRLALMLRSDGAVDIFRFNGERVESKPFESIPAEDFFTTSPLAYTTDGKTLYWRDSRGRDTAALIAEDVATGKRTVLGSDARADMSGILSDPATGYAQAYAVNFALPEWRALDSGVAPDIAFLEQHLKGKVAFLSRTRANDKWLVSVIAGDDPGSTWLYDRRSRALEKLFSEHPELDGVKLAPMQPVEIKARDGLTLVSYLTLPLEVDPDGAGHPTHPVPLVLWVHGGPWGRDLYGYNSVHQLLANRGYAAMSVNFRGSTGFGKAFIAAGDHEWGGKMEDDLADAVDWAVKNGITTPDKVAIAGESYGGYATLAGLAFMPGKFACGEDLFGPSDLTTLLQRAPSYWTPGELIFMARRVGDPATPEGVALLKARSPLLAANAIKRPLLVGQGTNDVRVTKIESDEIVAAMKANNVPVTYLVFPDEGHGFTRAENNLAFAAASEQFLAKCLGGRAEPIGAALKGSSVRVEEGVDRIDGLSAALATPH